MKMIRIVMISCCLVLFPLMVSVSHGEDACGTDAVAAKESCQAEGKAVTQGEVKQEAPVAAAPAAIEPPVWADDNDQFEDSFDGGEPPFGEQGDQGG